MATIPALSHPQYTFVFLAVRRTDYAARPFAARIPMNKLGEVSA